MFDATDSKKLNKSIFSSIWAFTYNIVIKKHLGLCLLGISTFCASLLINGIITNHVMEKLIDTIGIQNFSFYDGALYWLGWYALTFTSAELFSYIGKYAYAQLPIIEKEIRIIIYSYLKYISIDYFSNNESGSIENSIDNLGEGFRESLEDIIGDIIPSIIFTIIATIYLFFINYKVGYIYICITTIYFLLYAISCRFIVNTGKKAFKVINHRTGITIEILQNFKLTKVLNIDNYITNKVELISKEESNLMSSYFLQNAKFTTLCGLFLLIGDCCIVAFIIYYLRDSMNLTAGKLVNIINLLFNVSYNLWCVSRRMMDLLLNISRVTQSLSKIYNLPEEKVYCGLTNIKFGNISITDLSIRFKEKSIIENLFLEIKKGEKICIMGPSGCGKSTLLNMLCKILPVDDNKIFINGFDINNINKEEYKKRISYISQINYLFHGSILENIILGRPNITLEMVKDICKKVQIHDFIESLHKGYNFNMGINGGFLSVGQIQRIRLARDLISDGDLFVCDEATSALDAITSLEVIKNIISLSKEKTLLWVDHSNLVAPFCDKVILFSNNKTIEVSTHKELLNNNDTYKEIFNFKR